MSVNFREWKDWGHAGLGDADCRMVKMHLDWYI